MDTYNMFLKIHYNYSICLFPTSTYLFLFVDLARTREMSCHEDAAQAHNEHGQFAPSPPSGSGGRRRELDPGAGWRVLTGGLRHQARTWSHLSCASRCSAARPPPGGVKAQQCRPLHGGAKARWRCWRMPRRTVRTFAKRVKGLAASSPGTKMPPKGSHHSSVHCGYVMLRQEKGSPFVEWTNDWFLRHPGSYHASSLCTFVTPSVRKRMQL